MPIDVCAVSMLPEHQSCRAREFPCFREACPARIQLRERAPRKVRGVIPIRFDVRAVSCVIFAEQRLAFDARHIRRILDSRLQRLRVASHSTWVGVHGSTGSREGPEKVQQRSNPAAPDVVRT
jgi:hypothetical protein